MASRSPPLQASQNRRTNSRGVSLMAGTLLPALERALLDRGLLLRDRRLLLGRRGLLLDGGLLPCGRGFLLRWPLLTRGLRLLHRLLLGACLLRRQGGGVGDAEAQPEGEIEIVLDPSRADADHAA